MNKILISTLLAGLVGATAPLAAQEQGEAKPKSPVKLEMEKLDEAIDAVAEWLEKHEGKAPMDQITAAHAALQESKKHPPKGLEQQPEADRPAFLVDYKVQINKSIRLVLDLEDALLTGDHKAAAAALDAMKDLKKTAHRKFKGRRRRSRG